jgi:acyl-CoA synthetase (AMP-forming)/AMP-acid ligase II
MSIVQQLRGLATRQPDNQLYEWFERTSDGDVTIKHSFTYSQVWNRVSTLAHHLICQGGLQHGDRVLLCYPPCLDFLFAFLGCILANVIPVPAYPPNPQALEATMPSFTKIKSLVNAKIVLTNKQYNKWTSLSLFVKWPPGLKWIITDPIFASWTAPMNFPFKNVAPTDIAFLQFTSGSTGDPKGVIISHGALWESFRGMTVGEGTRIIPTHPQSIGEPAVLQDHSLQPPFTMVSWLPLYHDLGLIFAALLPIYRAGNALLCSPLDFIAQPLIWPLAMSKYKATISGAPNFAFDLVVRRWQNMPPHKRPNLDLSRIRLIHSGGETVRAKSLIDFAEIFKTHGFNEQALCPGYGFAECTVAACAEYSRELVFSKRHPSLVSCGSNFGPSGMLVAVLKQSSRLYECFERRISNLEADEGEVGEIIVTGNALASGYWTGGAAPEKAPQIFIPKNELPSSLRDLAASHPEINSDFWFATGDLGLLEDGHLYVTGRIKELIVIRGRNYVAPDIEHTIMTSTPQARPGCIAVVAISGPASATEEALVLCETRSTLPDREAGDAIRKIRSCVSEVHGIKVSVALLEKGSLPKTSSGKLQRIKASEMWKVGSLKPFAFSASAQSTVSALALVENPSTLDLQLKPIPQTQIPTLEPGGMTEDSETLAWNFAATYSDRFSALHAQIRRITRIHLVSLESSSSEDLCRDVVDISTEWQDLGLDSLSAVLIMQDLQDEANNDLKEYATPIVLSPSLLYEHKNVKSLIEHFISLHGFKDVKTTRNFDVEFEKPNDSKMDFEHAFELPQSVSSASYLVFAVVQATWMCFMWSAVMYTASFALSLVAVENLGTGTVILPLVHFGFLFSLAMIAVLLKKSLIGVYQPGCHPQYGEFHLRYWMVESAVNVVELLGMSYLHNTKAYEIYLGLLGVDVSPGATINTSINTAFDLLNIGQDSMIERCSMISCHSYQAGCLFLSRVNIGKLAVIEQRAVIQSSAMVWEAADTLHHPNRTPVGRTAIPPSPYVQSDNTILRHGSRQASSIRNDSLHAPTIWKIASEIPMVRWIYSIGLFWLSDLAVALSALASLKSTEWIMAHSGILPFTWMQTLSLGFDQAIGRNYAFTFIFGPHIFAPSILLLSQGTADTPYDSASAVDSITFQGYGKTFSGKILCLTLFTLVLAYLIWVIAMGAITLAVQHLLVPPVRHDDIVLQHSYSAAVRHLYANLVRRLHSLTFFLTTGKPE